MRVSYEIQKFVFFTQYGLHIKGKTQPPKINSRTRSKKFLNILMMSNFDSL